MFLIQFWFLFYDVFWFLFWGQFLILGVFISVLLLFQFDLNVLGLDAVGQSQVQVTEFNFDLRLPMANGQLPIARGEILLSQPEYWRDSYSERPYSNYQLE